MEIDNHSDLALSPESVRALEAHKRRLDDDIAAGRFKPGDLRCVTLPGGERFYFGHPHDVAARTKVAKRPWWGRLLGQR